MSAFRVIFLGYEMWFNSLLPTYDFYVDSAHCVIILCMRIMKIDRGKFHYKKSMLTTYICSYTCVKVVLISCRIAAYKLIKY